MNETTIADELTATSLPILSEGYTNVNLVSFACATEEQLLGFLKNQIVMHFKEDQFKILEIKKEVRSTNYLKNERPLRAFVVEGQDNKRHIFVFDVAAVNFSQN